MSVTVLTCVLGEPESLRVTHTSLKPFLSPQITWTVKFSGNTSLEFIKSFEGEHVYCHQSVDTSLYEGMNQGIDLVQSEHYFVLGAGDEVQPLGLSALVKVLESTEGVAATGLFCPIIWNNRGTLWPDPAELSIRMACPHPGAVLRTEHSRAIGGFDAGYRIAADYDHICRYVRRYGAGKTLEEALVLYAGGGMSEVRAFEGALEEELIRMRVWQSHEFAVHARLLRRSAAIAGSLFDQVAKMNSKP